MMNNNTKPQQKKSSGSLRKFNKSQTQRHRILRKKQPQAKPHTQTKLCTKYYPSKLGHHAHSPSADRAAYYRQQEADYYNNKSYSDSDYDSDCDDCRRKHKHRHKQCCCGTCCCPPPPCGWYPEAPSLGTCCGGYYDGLNGYVVYDTGNPSCISRPGAYISPNPLIPFTQSLPYTNLCSPCGCYGTEWDAGDPRPPPIPDYFSYPVDRFSNRI